MYKKRMKSKLMKYRKEMEKTNYLKNKGAERRIDSNKKLIRDIEEMQENNQENYSDTGEKT